MILDLKIRRGKIKQRYENAFITYLILPVSYTHLVFECPIFGHPRDFLQTKLPTHEYVLRCCFEERFKLSIETNNKSVSFSKVAGTVAEKFKCFYGKASIPTVSDYRIVQLINACLLYTSSFLGFQKRLEHKA